MQCPKCNCQLKRGVDKHSNTEIDYCGSCKGIWLDQYELQQVCKFAGPNITLPSDAVLSNRFCPRCQVQMHEFEYPETKVLVDMCSSCNGTWLDSGEIKEIELVRKRWALSLNRKAASNNAYKKQKTDHGRKDWESNEESDHLSEEKKYKFLDNLAKFIVAFAIISIVFLGINIKVNGWKRGAKQAKKNLKKYYSAMPAYDNNRQYIEKLIDAQHEKVYPSCKYREEVRVRRVKLFKNRYIHFNAFDREKYQKLMKEYMLREAQADNKTEFVDWTKTHRHKWQP